MANVSWALGVVEVAGGQWATAFVQPDDEGLHEEMRKRLKPAGVKAISVREWEKGLWRDSRCSVFIRGGALVEVHTGRSRVPLNPPVEGGPKWKVAAERGRVLLGLLPVGVFEDDGDGGAGMGFDQVVATMRSTVQEHEVLAGMARVLDAPEPYGRRW